MTLRPSGFPKARRQLLRHLEDPGAPIREKTGMDNQAGLDRLASHLRAAEMYWVAADMAALAVSSGAQLAAARWATADRPAPCGLLWWDGGIGNVNFRGAPLPVDGVAWGPAPDETCAVIWLIDRRRLVDAAAKKGAELIVEGVPPLVPMWSANLPVTDEPMSMAELPPEAPATAAGALAAAWLLMQQPMLIDRTHHRADGPTRRAHSRDGLPDPEVTVVDLRRQYVPQDQDHDANEGEGRRYRHRWVVSGHWRNQACGPGLSERRQTWIPSYVKGPGGAPLLSTERVNVWRR
ncbi:hypothetical protein TPA0910_87230 [Streptomyces hygroscopicus subsp. sporocinereus]|uniref:Uncharacterized protein n=1 Tax=Streptomyces hygroscopicus TaxID=1912 RepID=A0ABQ3UFC1_STRHY|nr:hypothetical protein [Streptomyces hygroscopicus]GHJ34290.1 hypothetical protein TPA0910_87230 [Streptomyces hygroscopicus]